MINNQCSLPVRSFSAWMKRRFTDFLRSKPALVQAIQAFFAKLGLEVRRTPPTLFDLLAAFHIRTVLDVGAHVGQFALEIRSRFPGATIYSFEPNPEPYTVLREMAVRDPLFRAYNIALADREDVAEMEINSLSPSSSLLPLAAMTTYHPEMKILKKIKVPVLPLDSWAEGVELDPPVLLKVDVQGLETQVIRGGLKTLSKVSVAVLEVSFQQLYLGQSIYDEIHRMMYDQGFSMQGMYSLNYDHDSGRQLWGDAVFVRQDKAAIIRNDIP